MLDFVGGAGLIALVLTVSALSSGIVERGPISFPIIFLGIGFLLGSGGLGVIVLDTRSPLLEAVATISLALVLFLDAVKLHIEEIRREWYVPFLTLGPGTGLVIVGISLASYVLVGTTPLQSLLLGASLASTDPVVLQDIIRDQRIPRSVRRTLSVEAGMNDIVVLPIVLILIAVLSESLGGLEDWVTFIARILVISPIVGLLVGGIGSRIMNITDAHFDIRREHQALYGIGLVLAAFYLGTVTDGDGFLAAFFAGLAVTLFNTDLCDCFMQFGETTSEMMMLLSFILFGSVLSTLLGTVALLPILVLAFVELVIVRPLALSWILRRADMSSSARLFIGWFGPRGLSSLLLALLAVQADIDDADRLLAITGGVVLVSVIVHGSSATPLALWYGRRVAESQVTLAEERESTFHGLFDDDLDDILFVSAHELSTMMESNNPPIVLDVRSRAHFASDSEQIPGSIRVLPDQIPDWAADHETDRTIVAYCFCPDEAASGRVVRQLIEMGFDARALKGGYEGWRSTNHPLEAKQVVQT